jgi:hypothetical protein
MPSSVGHALPDMQPGTHFDARLPTGSWCRSESKGVSLNCQVATHYNFLIAEWGEVRLDLREQGPKEIAHCTATYGLSARSEHFDIRRQECEERCTVAAIQGGPISGDGLA